MPLTHTMSLDSTSSGASTERSERTGESPLALATNFTFISMCRPMRCPQPYSIGDGLEVFILRALSSVSAARASTSGSHLAARCPPALAIPQDRAPLCRSLYAVVDHCPKTRGVLGQETYRGGITIGVRERPTGNTPKSMRHPIRGILRCCW